MLLLLLKNMMWAAWWPYATMLLALEKAAQQQRAAARPEAHTPRPERPSQPTPQPAQGHHRESVTGSDAVTTPEIAEPLREMMKLGIAQAQRAFETFVLTSERTWRSLESASPLGRAGLFALNAKIAEITRKNAEAHFALVMRLAEAKDLHEALELQNRHIEQQMDVFAKQLEEMRDLAAQLVQEETKSPRSDSAGARPAPQDNMPPGGARFASYAPSSSVTPGSGPGRSY
jgi:hypothetical protein